MLRLVQAMLIQSHVTHLDSTTIEAVAFSCAQGIVSRPTLAITLVASSHPPSHEPTKYPLFAAKPTQYFTLTPLPSAELT